MARNRRYYQRHKQRVLAQQKRYYDANKERVLARCKAYIARTGGNPSAMAERSRRYEERHREKRNADKRRQRAEKPGSAYAATKRYVRNHPEVKAHWDAARRAKQAGAAGSHTRAQWLEKLEQHGNQCAYCKSPYRTLTKDHDVPLSRGGSNDISNILPACYRCNSSKGKKTGEEFRRYLASKRADWFDQCAALQVV